MKHLFCLALTVISLSYIKADDTATFNAVAIDGKPADTAKDFKTNLNNYIDNLDGYLNAASPPFTVPDLIVFPEYAFTGIVGDKAAEKAKKINEDSEEIKALKEVSSKYKNCLVVANMLEQDADDKDKIYSTTVAVRDKILATYRKINIHPQETKLSSGDKIVKFTDEELGVVALMSGQDILFENPSQKMFDVDDEDPVTVIYTASLNSLAPFQAALGIHQGYAQANGVNLIAANYDNIEKGLAGSGLYSSSAVVQESSIPLTLSSTVPVLGKVPVLKARDVTKDCGKKMFLTNTYKLKSLRADEKFNFTLDTELTDGLTIEDALGDVDQQEVCDGDFCCKFSVNATWNINSERYRYAVKGGDVKVCAIMACDKYLTDNSCGVRRDVKTTFQNIIIQTNDHDKQFRPYTFSPSLETQSEISAFTFCENDDGTTIKTVDNKQSLSAVVFGIRTASSGAKSLFLTTNLIALMIALKYLF